MAWDTEGTKRALLAAAVTEFAQHGLAGARVDRIATSAGVNKERIYQYFGNKQGLFDAVLSIELHRIMDEVPLTGTGADAIGDYASRLFLHHAGDPVVPRLIFWEGLEKGRDTVAHAERLAHHHSKVDAFMAMLPGVSRTDAADLLLTIVTLSDAWPVLPQIDEFLAGLSPERLEQRRKAVATVATLVARDLLDSV